MAEETVNDPSANTTKRQGERGFIHDDINSTQDMESHAVSVIKERIKKSTDLTKATDDTKVGEKTEFLGNEPLTRSEKTFVSEDHTKAGQ